MQINNPIERFLARLRDVHPIMLYIYQRGGCYELFLMLREIWPEAEAWYAEAEGHIYTKIGNHWYDIRGQHVAVKDKIHFGPLEVHRQHGAFSWKKTIHVDHYIDGLDPAFEPIVKLSISKIECETPILSDS